MVGSQTEIKDPEKPANKPRSFTFDYSYWSHDAFTEESSGYMKPAQSHYADQKKVFSDLGRGVLDNAWEGFNCSLFAYGQTGSGKSYSMVGYGANKGVVPITCEELFKGIESKRASSKSETFEVTFSMIEIYNEQVRDLLNKESMKVKGGLKVRQSPTLGFYVEKLNKVPVNSYADIEKRINEGTKNRTVASTNMNATSSRAHTIVRIEFIQKTKSKDGASSKNSVINLVDLAGSERATSTGATGDRLKEGSAINQSLSTLGNCIKALASNSQGKKINVPFRDSMLTKLLKNALGGNSKTIMIAALSPADINYDETLSTLRFADRAKAIKTKAVVNQNATDKLISDLREENKKLLAELKKGGVMQNGEVVQDSVSEEEMANLRREMDEMIRKNQEEIENMNKSWEDKLSEQQKDSQGDNERQRDAQRMNVCHLWNLNEDQVLSGMIIHYIQPGKNEVGSTKNSKPDIPMSGLSIISNHAVINSKKDIIQITDIKGKVMLNGVQIKTAKEIHHNDRLMFGSSNLFVLHHPADKQNLEKKKTVPPTPTFDSAQEEITKNSGIQLGAGDKSKDDVLLQEDLVELWPMITESNAMSEELDKKMKFEVALIAPKARGQRETRTQVWVKVKDLSSKNEFLWDRSKFMNRRYLMQEMYQNYVEGDKAWDLPREKDPFWEDPNTEELIGIVHVFLQPLSYIMDMQETLKITDYRGLEQGKLSVELIPCSAKGGEVADEDYIDEQEQLIGKDLHFKLNVCYARGLPPRFVKTFCRYQFYLDNEYHNSAEISGTCNPDYKYTNKHTYSPVTRQFADYLAEESLVIEVMGRQKGCTESPDFTTSELMSADTPAINSIQSTQYKVAAELQTQYKRWIRERAKVEKVHDLVKDAKQKGMDTVKIADLDSALRTGQRFKAVANVIAKVENMSKAPERQTSEACVLQ